jgi:Fe2+ transport system protein B
MVFVPFVACSVVILALVLIFKDKSTDTIPTLVGLILLAVGLWGSLLAGWKIEKLQVECNRSMMILEIVDQRVPGIVSTVTNEWMNPLIQPTMTWQEQIKE